MEEIIRYGECNELASEIVQFLKEKEITYGVAVKALEDALWHLKRASMREKI